MITCEKKYKVKEMDEYSGLSITNDINDETGSHFVENDIKIIDYPFEKYQIKIKLNAEGKFLGIIQVSINKEFLSHAQKISSSEVHDIEEFYREDG